MITFLPYPDFLESVRCLDTRRLNKQRGEGLEIFRCLADPSRIWGTHPAVRMWVGHELALVKYVLLVCREWEWHGYAELINMVLTDELNTLMGGEFDRAMLDDAPMPPWLGDDRLHRSHRSNLLRKDPKHYGEYFSEPTNLEYFWPRPDDRWTGKAPLEGRIRVGRRAAGKPSARVGHFHDPPKEVSEYFRKATEDDDIGYDESVDDPYANED